MLQEHRHQKIESFLKQHKAVKAAELASLLNVSIDTVRRDLETLEKKGTIKRVHGGAILKQSNTNVLNKLFNERPMNVIIRWSFYFVEKKRLFDSVENKTYFQ